MTTPSLPVPPPHRPGGYVDPDAHLSGWASRVPSLGFLSAGIGGDLIGFSMALNEMLNGDPALGYLIAAACSIMATGLMFAAGQALRAEHAREVYGIPAMRWLGPTAWVLLGAAATVLRYAGGHVTAPSNGGVTVAAVQAQVDAANTDALLQALLLTMLYVGSGVLALGAGWLAGNPRQMAFARARRAAAAADRRLAYRTRRVAVAEGAVEHAGDEWGRARQRHDLTMERHLQFGQELKHRVRQLLAGQLADPAATSALTGQDPVRGPREPERPGEHVPA